MPLVVIEGIDGIGKTVQSHKLIDNLGKMGQRTELLDYPRYDHGSSILVKQYLAGKFGKDPLKLDPYMVAPFYTIDRVVSYLTDWQEKYQRGDWLVSNRYTGSSAIHQGAKLPEGEREDYFRWLDEVEHDAFFLPRPDLVILLDAPFEISDMLRQHRNNSDIHEDNKDYLFTCWDVAHHAASFFNWILVDCSTADRRGLRDADDIGDEILSMVTSRLLLPMRDTATSL